MKNIDKKFEKLKKLIKSIETKDRIFVFIDCLKPLHFFELIVFN